MPMLTYGCEVWALRKNDGQRLTAAEMRFMRRSAEYTVLDTKPNEDVLNELHVTPATKKIKDYRKKSDALRPNGKAIQRTPKEKSGGYIRVIRSRDYVADGSPDLNAYDNYELNKSKVEIGSLFFLCIAFTTVDFFRTLAVVISRWYYT